MNHTQQYALSSSFAIIVGVLFFNLAQFEGMEVFSNLITTGIVILLMFKIVLQILKLKELKYER